jgi:hypothetical protein
MIHLVGKRCRAPLAVFWAAFPGATTAQDPGEAAEPADRAFFEFQASHLRSLGWPEAYQAYELIVCNPALEQWQVDEIRRGVPGVTLLAYTDVQDAHIGLWPRSAYWRALTAAFDSTLCIQDLETERTIRIWGHDVDDPESGGLPAFVMSREAADILVEFHRDVTLQVEWDGFYLDVCNPEFPPWRKKLILARRIAWRTSTPCTASGDPTSRRRCGRWLEPTAFSSETATVPSWIPRSTELRSRTSGSGSRSRRPASSC